MKIVWVIISFSEKELGVYRHELDSFLRTNQVIEVAEEVYKMKNSVIGYKLKNQVILEDWFEELVDKKFDIVSRKMIVVLESEDVRKKIVYLKDLKKWNYLLQKLSL